MKTRRAYGERAEGRARLYEPHDRPLLVVSGDGAAPAIQEAVRLRERGERFDAAFILDEQSTVHARIFGREILGYSQDFDQRRNAFEMLVRGQLRLSERPQAELGQLAPHVAMTLRDIGALADGWLVQSWQEYRRNRVLLGIDRPVTRRTAADPLVPSMSPDASADAIVVWAPDEVPDSLAVVLFALEEVRRPCYVVCRPGPLYGLKTVFVPVDESERALARSRLIIDGSVDVPCAALAFLSHGIRAIASSTTGAQEYAPAIRLYEPSNRRSVFSAVMTALAEPCADVHIAQKKAVHRAAVTRGADLPKVSLIVRTFERPQFLRRALQSVAAQTYPNVEAVVVNNGGEHAPVADICAAFPNVSLVTTGKQSIALAANVGLERATGKYAGLLDDDDALFPDHVERLACALQRSGTLSAYANALNIYLNNAGSGFGISGYRGVHVAGLELSSMLVVCAVVGSCRMMFERAWVLASGGFDPLFTPADDYELWLRLLHADDITRVDAFTALYSQHEGQGNMSISQGAGYVEAHKRLYERYPVSRTALVQRRSEMLASLRQFSGMGQLPIPIRFDPAPELFER